ncbi:formate dehydrogenase [Frankia sp. R43]|uniref:molybdopterin-containing oxidoreductase family protein n=1 Tax=Frankia sp. R43 TaxID=269536 RepID=UPI0006CA0823|nr:molybdopterin-dependent oxidoreductase [Frankia sp. R43]KPM51925.1 formate dehydrogenase [Frankia sp. R43]
MEQPGERVVITHCRICAASCGVKARVDDATNTIVRIGPDKENPYTWRDFCAKGRTAADILSHPRRVLQPMRRVGDRYEPATWDEAITDIAGRVNKIIERDGVDAIGSYHGNPTGTATATAMFFPGLMDAIGSGNRFWVGSVDQNNVHVVSERLYGVPFLALVPDVDKSECVLLVGANPEVSGMHWVDVVPNGWARILAGKERGADLIVVDPRRTESAANATTHVAIRPGGDWAFLLGVLKVLLDNGWVATNQRPQISGVAELRKLTDGVEIEHLAVHAGVGADLIADVARRFAAAPTAFCMTRTGVAQTVTGTVTEWLSHVLNHVTGRIDVPGGRCFERSYVDGVSLWDKFAPPATHRSRLRGLPPVAGFHSLAELADEISTPGPGQIKAMFIVAGNPVISGPAGAALDEALASLELLVVVDLVQRESHRHADWILPDVHWLERAELQALLHSLFDRPFTQYGFKVVDPPPGCREAWEIFVDLALAMRRPMFGKRGFNTFVKATRTLARLTRRPSLAFRPKWIEWGLVRSGKRLKWRDILAHPHGWVYDEKEYGGLEAALPEAHKTIALAVPEFVAEVARLCGMPPPVAPAGFPLQIIGRRRKESMNSWLNENPALHRRARTNVVEIHPADAAPYGIMDGDSVCVRSAVGSIVAPARVSDEMRPGVIACEHGWGSGVYDPSGGAEPLRYGTNRNLLVPNREIDPLSQSPGLNAVYVNIERVPAVAEV